MTVEELVMPIVQPPASQPSPDDPLTRHPRVGGMVACGALGLLSLCAAFGVWWLAVRTEYGQAFDDMVWQSFGGRMPAWLTFNAAGVGGIELPGGGSVIIIAVSALLAIAALATALVRRRWWLVGQMAAFAALCLGAEFLKGVLPRPFIINVASTQSNSAPSGHTLMAFAAGIALLMAVPRAWRAVAAAVAAAWGTLVGMSVVAGRWHRPSDVVMALLIVGGVALLALAVTRTSGMDAPGRRVSSASVQIVGSVMITGGLLAVAYAVYVIWQVVPGLSTSAEWAQSGAVGGSAVMIGGLSALLSGLMLAMRQLTASPLTRLGLVGAPPAPPAPVAR